MHIILAFPNAYYARLEPLGKLKNMPAVQNEVLYAMQPELAPTDAAAPARFGAKDIFDLSWKSLLDAYSCTECGKCTAACPANSTGKLLSPRKIMMATRDRLEAVGKNINEKIIDTAFSANFSYHNGAANITGKEAAKAYYTAFFNSFSNGQLEILEMYEQGDKVICRWLFTGFHTGAYQGISATGVRVTVEGVSIARISGNLLTEERVYMNDLALLQQIGGVTVIKK